MTDHIKILDILSTTDFLGCLEPGENAGGALLTSYFSYLKSHNPDGTIILDAGDAIHGSLLSNEFQGAPIAEMMKMASYDGMCLGNHEFDWDIKNIIDLLNRNNLECICSSIKNKNGDSVRGVKPYIIIERHGLKIAVTGFMTKEIHSSTAYSKISDYIFEDPVKNASIFINQLKKNADIIILLGHLPVYTYENGWYYGELIEIANSINNVDAFIGGHSYTPVCTRINSIPLVLPAQKGNMIAHIKLLYNLNKKCVVQSTQELINVKENQFGLKPANDVNSMINSFKSRSKSTCHERLGRSEKDWKMSYEDESALGNWVVDVIKETADTDIAFYNSYGIFDNIQHGDITVEGIFRLCPFDNRIVKATMTGKDIRQTLEESLNIQNGSLQVSGIYFEYDPDIAAGNRIVSLTDTKGNQIIDERQYTVSTVDFLSEGGLGFSAFKLREWKSTGILHQKALVEDIHKKKVFNYAKDGRKKKIKRKLEFN
jgi:2',3'-cyclic-nucleotide 2'-phosphodiesterase (5'-nucleotidase family)